MNFMVQLTTVIASIGAVKGQFVFVQCGGVSCTFGEICVTSRGHCDPGQSCVPRPVCVRDPCSSVPGKCQGGLICVPDTTDCGTLTDCPGTKCIPKATPKVGFCPAEDQLINGIGRHCIYDADCPGTEICCQNSRRRNCAEPLTDELNPCKEKQCPSSSPTCALRDGEAVCLAGVCEPDTYMCRNGKQCYCNDRAQTVCIRQKC